MLRVALAGVGEFVGFGDFLEDNWDELAVGGASVVGFVCRGTPWGIALGAAAGGITAALQGEDLGGVFIGAALGGVGGFVGGLGSFGVKGFMGRGGVTTLARNNGWFGAVPRALGGGHLSPWRTYFGLLGMSLSGWTGDSIPETVYQHLGYPRIPLIDISETELDKIPDGMPHVYMPDPQQLPEGLEFTPPAQRNFRSLPAVELDCWTGFGEKPVPATELPEESDVTDIFGEESAGIPEYARRVELLRHRYSTIRAQSSVVAEAVKRSAELCRGGRGDLAASLGIQKEYVATDPRDMKKLTELLTEHNEKPSEFSGVTVFSVDTGQLSTAMQSEDAYTMVILESSYASVETIMSFYAGQFEEAAAAVQKKSQHEDSDSGSDKRNSATESGGERSRGPGSAVDPAADRPEASDGPEPNGVPAPEPLDLNAGSGSETDRGSGRLSGEGATGSPGDPGVQDAVPVNMPVVSAPAATNSGGMSSVLGNMMLPQLMRAAMGRGDAQDRGERDDRRAERERDAGSVTALRPGTVAAPGVGQPPPGQSAAQPPGQPGPGKAAAAPADNAPPPARSAATDPADRRVYTFPDGRTQEVSGVVAQALDTAFGNAAGTDARTAYAGTPAQWTDVKKIGRRTDPYQLMTGDIGVWVERTALLVVFKGPDSGEGTLEAVIDGALEPVVSLAEMRDGAGEFGPFTGFFHPPGIELTTTASPGHGDVAGTVDQPAAAAAAPA
ncbi:hypothetical protein [Nocardia carnea]|uniref:hypothetical protein n=1 Tax=Nocardia carnea TaxID=37328 RepID=UPI002456969C|nr:hypothetical protein [Nocardia carnea]